MSTALIIGAGPAGLMAADVLSAAGHQVTIADQMPSVGRKFLMAGKSGLNLTKDAPIDAFLSAFGDVPDVFRDVIRGFGPEDVQRWARDLGQSVFTGSTGRVFPKAMKASPLLRAWLARLREAGVVVRTRHKWVGWDGADARFETPDGPQTIAADVTVLALGGASWARLGSDGEWAKQLSGTTPFKPANCGFAVNWTDHMAPFFGQPVKATALQAGDLTSRGEWIITKDGIEGGGVYSVSAAVRNGARLSIDLMPDVTLAIVQARLSKKPKKTSRQQYLSKALRLNPIKVALFNELTKGLVMQLPDGLGQAVKSLQMPLLAPLPMDGSISTAGGLTFEALDQHLMLPDRPGVFAAGEMLDWEAPTGGYLITGCLASGRTAGQNAARWLSQTP